MKTATKKTDASATILSTIEALGAIPGLRNRWIAITTPQLTTYLRSLHSASEVRRSLRQLETAGKVERHTHRGVNSWRTARSVRSAARTAR